MVSIGGLEVSNARWLEKLDFDRDAIMSHWRLAVTSYLHLASKRGMVTKGCSSPATFQELIVTQAKRRWNIHITPPITKRHFLGYAGRYIRRLPISQKLILRATEKRVTYQTKDTRTKTVRENTCTLAEFVRLLSQHVGDHYKHSMRYFGLLAPRTKRETASGIYLQLNQKKRSHPVKLSWRHSLLRDFGKDPLIDSSGEQLRWSRRVEPITTRT